MRQLYANENNTGYTHVLFNYRIIFYSNQFNTFSVCRQGGALLYYYFKLKIAFFLLVSHFYDA